ncbi:MAG: glutamine-hydrolyzing carbamoyl-phosphate synthase small subunit [Kiritimatiellae bacterium]|jgi:carbamoyl-phosphate synthase small subunit|nr:glutamine-hydrolyzing carbamoyl-phosphate synthase small subunit [Kiritimatiellia bacterium]MDX9794155.1 glutamine-hydrolyzing carbamoyl-phosphate synthase small subunit [Kiritimatiellia bacterium]
MKNWKQQREKKAYLALEDGTVYRAWSFGAPVDRLGEVVFNTGMTGYQEILTDPSYAGQLVTLTAPEIGNTGFNTADFESSRIHAEGLIVHRCNAPSNWRAEQSLADALIASGVPGLAGIDTRALTIRLRNSGTLKGFLCATGSVTADEGVSRARAWSGLDNQDYAQKVSTRDAYLFDPADTLSASWGIADSPLPEADIPVVAIDYGLKRNILRRLRQEGMRVTVVPARTTAAEVLALNPAGVFLSNGPADPAALTYAIETIRGLIGKVPMMGICLGHQLLGWAYGGRTCRLKFGHHGCNHPVKELASGKVEITSQNHNFMVDMDSLDRAQVEVTHINLNDNTVEGMRHLHEPVFSVQYHPEAAPGPHDSRYVFNHFKKLILSA